MLVRTAAVLVATVLWGCAVRAELIIEGGTHSLQPNAVNDIPIYVSGDGEQVLGVDLYAQIEWGGDTPPVITGIAIDRPDCMFYGITYEPNVFSADSRTWGVNATVTTDYDPVTVTNNLIGWISIDTTGTLPGQSFALRLQNILPDLFPPNGCNSGFADDTLNVTIHDGVLNIVPEPSSLAMLGGFGVVLAGWLARRQGNARKLG
jgi:hypothetical protein